MKKVVLLLTIMIMLAGCTSSDGSADGNYCFDSEGDGNYSCYEAPEYPDYGPEDGWRY